MKSGLYNIPIETLSGEMTTLEPYRGKVMLIVNVASKCGFTPTYKVLQQLHDEYSHKGLVVLGFPCNQFAKQEPGNAEEIRSFCTLEYGISFPLFKKIDVNGKNTHPLYKLLKQSKPGLLGPTAIKWNFTKFLDNRKGEVVRRFAPLTKDHASLAAVIEAEL